MKFGFCFIFLKEVFEACVCAVGKLSVGCYVALAQQQLLFGNSFLFKSLLALHLEKKTVEFVFQLKPLVGIFFFASQLFLALKLLSVYLTAPRYQHCLNTHCTVSFSLLFLVYEVHLPFLTGHLPVFLLLSCFSFHQSHCISG